MVIGIKFLTGRICLILIGKFYILLIRRFIFSLCICLLPCRYKAYYAYYRILCVVVRGAGSAYHNNISLGLAFHRFVVDASLPATFLFLRRPPRHDSFSRVSRGKLSVINSGSFRVGRWVGLQRRGEF